MQIDEQLALFGGKPVRKSPISLSKPFLDQEEINNVIEVLKSNWIAQGPKVEEFETNFAEYIGTEYAVAVSSGTAALHLALLSLGVKPKNEIIIPDITCISVPNAVSYVNAFPRFVDIELDAFNLSLNALESKITEKTKAIIPIHLYGHPVNLDELCELSQKKNVYIIEDCAHAHGAEYKGRRVGSFGDVGIFSTYATKNITTGEGGILVTNNKEIAKKVKTLRDQDKSQNFPVLAYNYKMTDLAAAIGLAQLNKLDRLNMARIENASFLSSEIRNIEGIRIPTVADKVKHVFHRYTIFFELKKFKALRNTMSKALKAEGIKNGVLYTPPAHRFPYYKKRYNFKDSDFINAELSAKSILSVPVHPRLEKNDLKDIVMAIKKVTHAYYSKIN